MKANKDRLIDHLTDLQLRPVTSDLHQIRYWSALDDPSEEKWDYTSHISRVDRKYPNRSSYTSSYTSAPVDFEDEETRPAKSKTWLLILLIVLVLAAASVAGYFVWVDYIAPAIGQSNNSSGDYAPVQGYIITLGNREIGIVSAEDRAVIEAYVQNLTMQAQTQAGTEVLAEQSLQFTPVTVDAIYVPDVNDVNAVIARHMVFVPVAAEEENVG